MKCKYWDCGWCYAPPKKGANDKSGQCLKPDECDVLNRQKAQHYIARVKAKS